MLDRFFSNFDASYFGQNFNLISSSVKHSQLQRDFRAYLFHRIHQIIVMIKISFLEDDANKKTFNPRLLLFLASMHVSITTESLIYE